MQACIERPEITLVAMPCWTVKQPSHSLAIVGSLARASGLPHEIHDLNIRFFRQVDDEEKKIWDDDVINLWLGDTGTRLWEKYEGWLHAELDRVLASRPKLVAFTVNMWTRAFSVRAAQHIRKVAPGTVILFGGVDCFVGEHNKKFLEEGVCDIICQGEAEISFAKFLSGLKREGWKTKLPGFAYYDDRGALADTGRVELPTFREPQPAPIYDAFDLSEYLEPGRIPFFFSRGCPFTCRFCSETVNFSRFRCRDPEEAFRELLAGLPQARKYADTPIIDFSDSIFNANIRKFAQFCDLIMRNEVKVIMAGQGHLHHTMTTDIIQILARAGFLHIFWGFESGSQKVVNLMKKAFRVDEAIRIFTDCANAGISQYLPVLVGFPGEEPEDLAVTIEFILTYQDLPNLRFFQPSPVLVRQNAELYERFKDFGLKNNEVLRWESVSGDNTYLVRLARCFVASQAQANRALTREGLVCADYLGFDLNERAVAEDLFRLIRDLYARTGGEQKLARYVDELCALAATHGSLRLASVVSRLMGREPAPGDAVFSRWLAADKNPTVVREVIYAMVLDALARLKNKVRRDFRQPAAVARSDTRVWKTA